ncbi:MAG TPA: aldehyde dehydrogenase family protein, partial [Planctomicrobium sp.]|nr:aldehyde dehydrogenase family protein [Planctomicrobium sp.]
MLMQTEIERTFPRSSQGHRTSQDALEQVFDVQMHAYEHEPYLPRSARVDCLNRLLAMIEEHESEIIEAIDTDYHGRSSHETRLAELFVVRSGILHARRYLKSWMRERRVPTGWAFLPGRNRLIRQPLGVVGVVSPWNYPLQLALCPTLAALAAGNRVMIKPSELTPRFSELLERLISETFAVTEVAVINGGPEVGEAFTRLPFHHLLFTGSTGVGRKVAVAAAGNLTPVTLELGGKSPVIIDSSADLA